MLSKRNNKKFKYALHFFFAFGLGNVIFGDEFDVAPWITSIKSAGLALFFVMLRGFLAHDDHVIYSSQVFQNDIVKLIEQKGFQLTKQTATKKLFTNPNFWNRTRFKLENTDYHIKLYLPEEYVDEFEHFVR